VVRRQKADDGKGHCRMNERLLKVSDIATRMNLSTRAIWNYRDMGFMPTAIKVGGAVRWRERKLMILFQACVLILGLLISMTRGCGHDKTETEQSIPQVVNFHVHVHVSEPKADVISLPSVIEMKKEAVATRNRIVTCL
jgi:predicted DNA-binding transcriptional regulator AlpA